MVAGALDDGYIAEALGHAGFLLHKNARGDRFYVTCGCGYRSATRVNVAMAIEAGQHHLRKVVREFKATGAPLPRNVGASR